MRYYHPFPEAIPRLEVGCSRVTHPSATKNQKQALNSPFDLHVLGVPPAFVLSQDQTLHKFVSLQDLFQSCHNQLFTNHSQLLLLCYSLFADFSNLLIPYFFVQNRNLRVPVFLLALFSFQDANSVAFQLVSFTAATSLLYHTSLPLSSPFLKVFLWLLRWGIQFCFAISLLPATSVRFRSTALLL